MTLIQPLNSSRLKFHRLAAAILLGTSALDLLGRTLSSFDPDFIHIFEAIIFIIAATLLILAALRDRDLSVTAFRVDIWLSLAFALGGIRAALWAVGIEIQLVNLMVLVLGVIAAPIVFASLRKHKILVPPPEKSQLR